MSENFITASAQERVMVITLNRPEALNAFCRDLISQLNQSLREAEASPTVGVILLTGKGKAFAAGADIKEMMESSFADSYKTDFIALWEFIGKMRKPIIAAVSGYALGGGCELAMMCDMILASPTAQFGQPEIALGTIPGFGGTQRLTRLIGKTKAMEMCLTGRMMGADEAEACGLVTRIIPLDTFQEESLALAQKIAGFSQPVVELLKEAICASENMSLSEGLRLEQSLFQKTFSLKDRQEGMKAFLEKRKPVFSHK